VVEYEVTIDEEMNEFLQQVAETAELSVQELVQNLIEEKLEENKADMIIELYKAGKLKAREAWKLSGLNYQEFQNRATN
jgi:hypothetical protein